MLIQIGNNTVDVNAEKTREYYKNTKRITENCSCRNCQNFEAAAGFLPQDVIRFFSELGVDLKKICECYEIYTKSDGWVYCGGFCHVCGRLLEGDDAFFRIDGLLDPGHSRLEDRVYRVSFRDHADLLEEGFPLPAIQIEFEMEIPRVLETEQ